MLHIKCDHCGADLKGSEVIITSFDAYFENIKYKDYTATCSKCGGIVVYDKCTQMRDKNKAKAMAKLSKKTGRSVAQISEAEQYNTIMHKVGKKVPKHLETPTAKMMCFNKLVADLPPDEKKIVLEYEDKQDVALLHKKNNKPTNIEPKSILLLTQSIIELAIADKDEDFFQSKYGEHIVDAYNTALTLYTKHDYEITAELLLEKMRKGVIVLNAEEMRRGV